MNITGTFFSDHPRWYVSSYSGAFYKSETHNHAGVHADEDWDNTLSVFDASRSWTGRTSVEGSHSHTLSLHNTGGSGLHNNVQPTFGVYIFKRTA